MGFTEAQRAAIFHKDGNLLLSAAAGSGKTTVLVERVLQLILSGHSVQKMLIVTFTRAAAADMREKLFSALASRAEESAELREQLDMLETASVTTIHSFCLSLLRDYFEAAEVDPTFRLMDEAEQLELLNRSLDAAMEECYEKYADDGDHQALLYGRNAKAVRNLALALHGCLSKRPDPEAFQNQSLSHLESGGPVYFQELTAGLKRKLSEARSLYLQAITLAKSDPCLEKNISPLVEDDQGIEEMIRGAFDLSGLYEALNNFSFARLPVKRKTDELSPGASMTLENIKALRDRAKDILNKEKKQAIDIPLAVSDLKKSAGPLGALLRITWAMDENLNRLKAERGAYSFDDLERRALKLLRREDIRASLREKYEFVFVDEYQDISDMQEAIIRHVAGENNLFMVGDVKQSIYRFRDAEPSLFNDKYRSFGGGHGGRLIALSQNFRSREAILSFVNDVFEGVFRGGDTEIEYDADARLYPGMDYPDEDPAVELFIIASEDGDPEEQTEENESDDAPLTRIEREAVLAARRIRQLIGQMIYDAKAKAHRPIEYRDIAVIARTNGALNQIGEVFKALSIPAIIERAGSAFDTLEIRTAMSLLTVIDNHRRDIPLMACLRSPIVGLTSSELAKIRENAPEGSFRDACLAYLEKDDEIAGKLNAFEKRLDRYRHLARALPLSQFIRLALNETGYIAFASALPGGVERAANLLALSDRAGNFERNRGGGLSAFIEFIDQVIKSGGKFPAAQPLTEGENGVFLLTAHKSKGLEYPVVIAVDLAKSLSKKPVEGELCLDRDLGIGMYFNDPELMTRRDTVARRAIQERGRIRDLNEEMRVLYVLLTRAREKLILIGTVEDLSAARLRFRTAEVTRPGAYLDAIGGAVLKRPGGEALLMPFENVEVSGAPVDVRVFDGEDLTLSPSDLPDDTGRILFSLSRALSEDGDEGGHIMDAKYPYDSEVMLPVKTTVTALIHQEGGEGAMPELYLRPRFMTEASLTSAERGTLLHAALQALTLAPLSGLTGAALRQEIENQLESLHARRVLFEKPEAGPLARFFEGETGKRLLSAKTVHREWPFNLRMGGGDTALLQGVIDCCFFEEGRGITILDYKSDAVYDPKYSERYEKQLSLYALALSQITGEEVFEKRLILLRANQEILFP